MNAYKVKEIYYTLQGEGAQTGRPAVFLRCNLWSGREEDRSGAICAFCDTDFVGTDGTLGGRYTAEELAVLVASLWPKHQGRPYVVCTGGEPLLQMDEPLINAIHDKGFEIGIETNGTISLPQGLDWVCVSPKANTDIVVRKGDELKLIVRQKNWEPILFESWDFENFYVQPMDGPDLKAYTDWAVKFCMANPKWKLSIQTHKLLGIR